MDSMVAKRYMPRPCTTPRRVASLRTPRRARDVHDELEFVMGGLEVRHVGELRKQANLMSELVESDTRIRQREQASARW